MHVTLVHVQVKPERVEAFIEATRINHEGAIKEKGNRRFDILQDTTDPGKFILYEAYATAEDAKAHKDTLHYVMWREQVALMMANPREGIQYKCLFPKD
jgi:autoinducer 2-degrading protein